MADRPVLTLREISMILSQLNSDRYADRNSLAFLLTVDCGIWTKRLIDLKMNALYENGHVRESLLLKRPKTGYTNHGTYVKAEHDVHVLSERTRQYASKWLINKWFSKVVKEIGNANQTPIFISRKHDNGWAPLSRQQIWNIVRIATENVIGRKFTMRAFIWTYKYHNISQARSYFEAQELIRSNSPEARLEGALAYIRFLENERNEMRLTIHQIAKKYPALGDNDE